MYRSLHLLPVAAAFAPLPSASVVKRSKQLPIEELNRSERLEAALENMIPSAVIVNGPLDEAAGVDEVESNDEPTQKPTATVRCYGTDINLSFSSSPPDSPTNSPTIYHSEFDFGSTESAPAEPLHPAIQLNDMCETGGITVIILIVIVVGVLVLLYVLLHLRQIHVASLLYSDGMANQSMFRRYIMVPLEHIFVLPFVPTDLPSFVLWIFGCYIAITVQMGITRYYESAWKHDTLVLQGPLNMISYLLGCNSLNLTAVVYTEKLDEIPPRFPPPPKSDKWGRIDWLFSLHLCVGLMWLTVGCFQIYFTPATSWKAHRIFGRVAVVVLVGHIIMMAVMTYENPVNQHLIIIVGYVGMICNAISNLWQGINYARMTVAARREEEEKNSCVIGRFKNWVSAMFSSKKQTGSGSYAQLHKMCMFNVYVRSTMGSGSIRIAAWALLLVGHFLSPETRVLIDRGACQSQGLGDATDCWRPVFVNMLFTDLIVIWLELLFLVMPANMNLEAERNKKRDALERQIIIIVPSVFLVLVYLHIERWLESSSLPYSNVYVLKNLAEFSPFIWYLVVHKYDEIRAGYSYMCEQLHVHRQVHEQEQNHRSVTNAMHSMFDRLFGMLPERNTLKNLALMSVPGLRLFTLFSEDENDSSGVRTAQPMTS